MPSFPQAKKCLKEDSCREHLGDKDHKSTDRLQSHQGCSRLDAGFLKIAPGYMSLFPFALRKLKNSSRRSGNCPVKSDARYEVSLPRNKRKPERG